MREPISATAGLDEADSELELDAQALRELAVATAATNCSGEGVNAPLSSSENCHPAQAPSSAIARPSQPPDLRSSAIPRITAAVALAIGSLSAGAAVYVAASSRVEPASAIAASQWSSEVLASTEEPVDEKVEPPMLFANPFDPSEVFEFPSGTSEAMARELVAQALMERAAQRHLHASN